MKHFYNASFYNLIINISSIILLFYFFIWFSSSPPQYLCHVKINSLIIGMIVICYLHNKNIWENVSKLKCKYTEFAFKCFAFSPFEVSCLNTYRIAVMCFSTVYKASVGSEILHVFSSSNSTFFCLFSL